MIEGLVERVRRVSVVARWLDGEPLPPALHLLLGLGIPLWILCVNMWRVHWFTYDDAYISFRYARNLADGLGLVYNPGERIEGYTNFAWTVMVAAGMKVGVDPHVTAKLAGGGAAIGTLLVVYRLADRIAPLRAAPCIATWLLASSSTFSGYAMFGLETIGFVFLVMLGTWLMFREVERDRGIPWSGLVFALAGLTRPEAPMFLGIPMLLLGRRFFARQNLLRGVLFAAPLALHLLWRHDYYGAWLPATLSAKTGNLRQQVEAGKGYLEGWLQHAGPIVFLMLYGIAVGVVRKHRETLTLAAVFTAICGYVLLVGGDWMSYFRFMAPAEPYAFLLVGMTVRAIIEHRKAAPILALGGFLTWVGIERVDHIAEAQKKWLAEEKRFWDNAAGQAAEWLATRGKPGRVAIGDIGYVGYRTNYPILDLLGLVDPVISQLPGGYTQKIGKGYKERFFDVMPEYVVIIMNGQACKEAGMKASRQLYDDRRFRRNYAIAHNIQVVSEAGWCIFKRKDFE
ncbi:MAG: hypothetical protein AAGA54_31815 [Myxococcota bacterium]